MEEHNGEEFAGFGEDEGDVVDVAKGGISERCSEGRRNCNEEVVGCDLAGREDGRYSALTGGVEDVEVTNGGCTQGLDG